MRLRTRFSLIGLGIILFLIITPSLVLYARGFKIDLQNRKITKTGAMMIKTDPSNAEIFLNNVRQSDLTPSNIRFLMPGDYDVRIEKDGYLPWSKRLSVREQFVTRINLDRDFITLFFKNPKLLESLIASMTSISKTGDEITLLNNGQIGSININNGNEVSLGGQTAVKLPLLPGSDLVHWQNSKSVFQAMQNRTDWGLTDTQISQITRIDTNGTHYAASLGPDLYSLDKTMPLLLDKNVTTFTLNGDSLWYISANLLKRYNYSSGNTEIINQAVPITSAGQIIGADNQLYFILDSDLYILNDDFEKIYDNVTSAVWNSNAKLLLFATNNEILLYDPAGKKTDLILRSSGAIKKPVLNWAAGYIFFENEGRIKAVELDGRDHRNIYTIADQPDSQSSFAVSEDGGTLYIFSNTKIDKYSIR